LPETFPAQYQVGLKEIHDGLEKVFKVSKFLNFPFTLEEVASYFLPRMSIEGEQLRAIVSGPDFADIPFHISDGYLLTRANQSTTFRLEREQMSAAKLDSAAKFARVLTRLVPFIRTVAVTGSVAYGSEGKWDDIDLFIVTKRNTLWITAFMTLVLVRLNKILGLKPAHLTLFCLSYVHDEEGFAKESQSNRTNPLFARELIKAKPVAGTNYYRKILENNNWVGGFYSLPYAAKLKQLGRGMNGNGINFNHDLERLSFLHEWANGMAFTLLSRYLRLRAYLTNLQLNAQGQRLRVFEPKISPVSCVYTSNFYRWLGELWGQ
jgi:hypothetical protein